LVIHSGAKEEDEAGAWAKLAAVENHRSPVRIIFSVGMLREGWDVKNVYVLMSTRPSISQVLTEQVLGRGLRLPYGALTQIPLLDTLDVIAHEQYEKLLSASGILNETFVSHVTRQRAARDSAGKLVKQEVNTPVQVAVEPTTTPATDSAVPAPAGSGYTPVIELVDSVTRQAEIQQPEQGTGPQPVPVAVGAPQVLLPILTRIEQPTEWSLTEITDLNQFVALGRMIAADPPQYLRRATVEAHSIRHADGTITTQISQAAATDRIEASGSTVPTEDARERLIDAIMGSKTVSARADRAPSERKAAGAIVDRFVHGLNGDAQNLLSTYLSRATARLLKALEEARKRTASKPTYDNRVDFRPMRMVRENTRPTETALSSRFPLAQLRGIAFEGFKRSVFGLNWFDSNTERQLAVLLDDPQNPIEWWVRLLANDLPIMINDQTGRYNPDFIAIDSNGTHWVVETKKDDDMASDAVVAKREAARLWANTVNANRPDGTPEWRYVLASEADVDQAGGSWNALLKLTNSEWA
jgi:type III restriction enzyme